jgi:membrane-associated protease RseP (regulator of RpoE activity)
VPEPSAAKHSLLFFFCVLRAPWKTVKTIALLLMAATSIFASTNAPQRLGVRVTSSEQSGAEITQVIPGSAAEAAGLRAGYVINSVDTKPVRTAQDFEIALANRVPGSMIRVTYIFRSKLGWLSNEVDVTFPAASENIGQQFSRKMSNTDVIDMASLGLSDDVIVDKIRLAQASRDSRVHGAEVVICLALVIPSRLKSADGEERSVLERNICLPSTTSSVAGHSSAGNVTSHALRNCSLRCAHRFLSFSRRQGGT